MSVVVAVVLAQALDTAEVAAVEVVGRWCCASAVLVVSSEVVVLGGCWCWSSDAAVLS